MRPGAPVGVADRGHAVRSGELPADAHERIRAVIRRIPRGRVATYGQVALLAGLGRRARLVGYVLRVSPEGSGLPWQRVLNAAGRVSDHPDPLFGALQRALLEAEGVRFEGGGAVDLGRYRWRPRSGKGGGPCGR